MRGEQPSHRRLAGRVALVTGASRGLGATIARVLGAEGASVAVTARTEQVWDERLPGTIGEVTRQIEDAGGRSIAIRCDVTVDDDLVHAVERTREEFGPIDLLVNNAAFTAPGRPGRPARQVGTPDPAAVTPPLATPIKSLRMQFEVNVVAAYRLMQLVAPDMITRGRGSIVNVSSDAALRPGEGPYGPDVPAPVPAYGATKAALQNLTQAAAFELAGSGIAVNALLPSRPIDTPGLRFYGHDPADLATPESFAEAVVRLALDDPAERTGWIAFHEDVLQPALGRRGWLATDS